MLAVAKAHLLGVESEKVQEDQEDHKHIYKASRKGKTATSGDCFAKKTITTVSEPERQGNHKQVKDEEQDRPENFSAQDW